jgi:hypothetical protein
MLTRGPETFTTSVTDFLDHEPGRQDREARIYIPIKVERLETEIYAMVDTGSTYSILNREIAENAGLDLSQGDRTKISTRIGPVLGQLVRGTIIIPASEGTGLQVDATIFVPEDTWPLQNFVGYHGFLEGMRFAISSTEYEFHFGAAPAPRQPRLI